MIEIRNLVSTIKNIPGVLAKNSDILQELFEMMIKNYDVRNQQQNLIEFTDRAATRIMNGEPILKCLSEYCERKDNIQMFEMAYDKNIKKNLFSNVDELLIRKKLQELVVDDEEIDKNLYEKLMDHKISVGTLLANILVIILKRNYHSWELKKTKKTLPNKKINIFGEMIDCIISLDSTDYKQVPRVLPYTLEQKMIKNKFPRFLKEELNDIFEEDYDKICTAIEEAYDNNTEKNLYRYYKTKYGEVLTSLGLIDCTNEEIIEKSNEIFNKVNNLVALEVVNQLSNYDEITVEIYVRSITTFVFYQCKILVPIEEEKHNDNKL